jgi:hypothetical protein
MNLDNINSIRSQWAGTRNVEEWTELSDQAKNWAANGARAALGEEPWFKAEEGSSILIFARGALNVIVGQRSATGHGKQGLHPRRIAALRAFDMPTRLVFWDGGKWQAVWIGLNEPEFAVVQNEDKSRPRFGWRVRDMIRAEGALYFSEEDAIMEDARKQNGAPTGLFA